MTSKLAVAGSPVAHSRSPELHLAAYRTLGVDWSYERIECAEADLSARIASLDATWVGLSLTMPLKAEAARLATSVDADTALTRACNTLLFDHENKALRGFNTDVNGLARVIHDCREPGAVSLTLIGGGATAVSALVSAQRAGFESVDVFVRDTSRVERLVTVAADTGIVVTAHDLAALSSEDCSGLTVCTLPGDVRIDLPEIPTGASLIDVAYAPWPTTRAHAWMAAGGRVRGGLHMLARQALLQVRIFVTGSPETAVDNEAAVWDAMCDAVGLDV